MTVSIPCFGADGSRPPSWTPIYRQASYYTPTLGCGKYDIAKEKPRRHPHGFTNSLAQIPPPRPFSRPDTIRKIAAKPPSRVRGGAGHGFGAMLYSGVGSPGQSNGRRREVEIVDGMSEAGVKPDLTRTWPALRFPAKTDLPTATDSYLNSVLLVMEGQAL